MRTMSDLIKEALCKKMNWAYSTWCGLPPVKKFIDIFYKWHAKVEVFLEKYAPHLVKFWRSVTLKRIIVVTLLKWVIFYQIVFGVVYCLFTLNPTWTRIFSTDSAILASLHVTFIEDYVISNWLPFREGRVAANVSALKLIWKRMVEAKDFMIPVMHYILSVLISVLKSIRSIFTLETFFAVTDFICLMAPFWYFICVCFELVRYVHTLVFLKVYWNSIKLFLSKTKVGVFFRPYFVVRKESYFGEAINHFFKF